MTGKKPFRHWSFRAVPTNIDISRILTETRLAGGQCVKITLPSNPNNLYHDLTNIQFFILEKSFAAKFIEGYRGSFDIVNEVSQDHNQLVFNNKYGPYISLQEDECHWFHTSHQSNMNSFLERMRKYQEFQSAKHRITVEVIC